MHPDLALAHRLADLADAISHRHFTGGPLEFRTKPDGSPVTDVDEEVERTLRDAVARERPDDGFLGEEVGATATGPRRWIVDGIDGTVNYVAGHPGWGTEIALEDDGRVVVAVSTSPAARRRHWARLGEGACRSDAVDGSSDVVLAVSRRPSLDTARVTCIPPLDALGGEEHALARRLTDLTEYLPPVDHGALLVADGVIDAYLQLGGGPWDFAAVALVVEEAGGRYSDLGGRWRLDHGGPAVFSNGHLHDGVLAVLG
jgi:histidinol-phosphatase